MTLFILHDRHLGLMNSVIPHHPAIILHIFIFNAHRLVIACIRIWHRLGDALP